MNLPNKLTLIRMALVPIFIACFYLPIRQWHYIAVAVFSVAYFTDVLDGYYARKYNLITDFGKLMDPIADKLLSAGALIMLTARGMLDPLAATIMIAREFVISGFRMVSAGKGRVIAADRLGKFKTATQVAAIILTLLQNEVFQILHFQIDQWVVWISVFFTVASAVRYIQHNKDCIDLK